MLTDFARSFFSSVMVSGAGMMGKFSHLTRQLQWVFSQFLIRQKTSHDSNGQMLSFIEKWFHRQTLSSVKCLLCMFHKLINITGVKSDSTRSQSCFIFKYTCVFIKEILYEQQECCCYEYQRLQHYCRCDYCLLTTVFFFL